VLLDGKVAIVSGVGPGLGQANARALAREGATVVLAARNAEYLAQVQAEIERDGGRALAVPTNLVDREAVDALVARTVDAFSRLDILVNNAFRMDRGEPFETAALDHWRKVYDVNVWGALGLTQACIPHLRDAAGERGDASIVFILSMSMRKIRPNEGAYSTSKGALRTAVQTLALELGPAGVRVNGVAPGWIGGPNVEVFIQWESENRSVDPQVVREEIEARIPLGLIPPQDEIAHSVVFFASPWSKVVTGQTLDVNGGEWFD
jgi:NAD(P)-dependent dehydrogenase (short-subunit alcohol dehydrogenase family)